MREAGPARSPGPDNSLFPTAGVLFPTSGGRHPTLKWCVCAFGSPATRFSFQGGGPSSRPAQLRHRRGVLRLEASTDHQHLPLPQCSRAQPRDARHGDHRVSPQTNPISNFGIHVTRLSLIYPCPNSSPPAISFNPTLILTQAKASTITKYLKPFPNSTLTQFLPVSLFISPFYTEKFPTENMLSVALTLPALFLFLFIFYNR